MQKTYSKLAVIAVAAALLLSGGLYFSFRAYNSYQKNLADIQNRLLAISERVSKTENTVFILQSDTNQTFSEQEESLKEQKESLTASRSQISSLEENLSKTTKSLEASRQQSQESILNLQRASDMLAQSLNSQLASLESQVSSNKNSNLPQSLIQSIIGATIYVFCSRDSAGRSFSSGSGFNTDSKGIILTNAHVVKTRDGSAPNCIAVFPDFSGKIINDAYHLELQNLISNDFHDKATLRVFRPADMNKNPRSSFSVSGIGFCDSSQINIGDEVTIFGYPSIGGSSITLTTGVISGPLEDNYYKTSAKIDRGSSGGVAILNKNQCNIGIPTWLESNIESIARIQYWE